MSPKTKRPRFWETQSSSKVNVNVTLPIQVASQEWLDKAKESQRRLEKRITGGKA